MSKIAVLLAAICVAFPAVAQPTPECDRAWADATEARLKVERATKGRMAKGSPLPDQCGATREMLLAYQAFGKVITRCEFVTGVDIYVVADGTADEVRRLEGFMKKKCNGLAKTPTVKDEKSGPDTLWSVQKNPDAALPMVVQKFDPKVSSYDGKAFAVVLGCVAQNAGS